jgi:hypothetical protein
VGDRGFILSKRRCQPVENVFGIKLSKKAHKSKNLIANAGVSIVSVVAQGGIEPPTQGVGVGRENWEHK